MEQQVQNIVAWDLGSKPTTFLQFILGAQLMRSISFLVRLGLGLTLCLRFWFRPCALAGCTGFPSLLSSALGPLGISQGFLAIRQHQPWPRRLGMTAGERLVVCTNINRSKRRVRRKVFYTILCELIHNWRPPLCPH